MGIIIIRGPAGVGKSTIAKEISKILSCTHVSFDKVMKENNLDKIEGDGISEENFIKANKIVIPQIRSDLAKNKNVILDGCFYRKKQLEHLKEEFSNQELIFSLSAPLIECVERNKMREDPMSEEAIKEVYELVNSLDVGETIDTSEKSIEEIVQLLQSKIN